MSVLRFGAIAAALLALGLAAAHAPSPVQAQEKAKEQAKEKAKEQAKRPQIETTKVDGTDNVYIFRNGNHQAMFVVTPDGVIATDPVAYGRPTGHPGQPNGRLGTKKDAEDVLKLYQAASAGIQQLAREGKCWEPAEKEFKLDAYASWPGYANSLPFIARRYCGLWGRGT